MYINKLSIEAFNDYQIKGKKPQSDKIATFSFHESMTYDSEKLEPLLDAVKDLHPFDPVRLVVSYETDNA